MLELVKAGGWGMVPILICAVLVLGLVLERFWSLRRTTVIPPKLGEEVRAWAAGRRLDAAHIDALEKTSPLGEVLGAALRVRHLGRDAVRDRVEDAGRHAMHGLDFGLTTLGTMALIAPLLGLLGTVAGMIRMFLSILEHGVGDAQYMAGGIGEALICTAAGILVAVPAYVFHRMFRARVHGYGIAMEREVLALMDSLDETSHVTQAAAPRRATR